MFFQPFFFVFFRFSPFVFNKARRRCMQSVEEANSVIEKEKRLREKEVRAYVHKVIVIKERATEVNFVLIKASFVNEKSSLLY